MIWIKDKNNQFTSFYCQESLDSFTKVSKIHSGLPCCLHMFFFVCLRFVWWFPPLFPFASGQITSRFKTLLHYWFYWNLYLFDHPGYHLDISSWLDINRIPSLKKWIKWKKVIDLIQEEDPTCHSSPKNANRSVTVKRIITTATVRHRWWKNPLAAIRTILCHPYRLTAIIRCHRRRHHVTIIRAITARRLRPLLLPPQQPPQQQQLKSNNPNWSSIANKRTDRQRVSSRDLLMSKSSTKR